MVGYGYITKLGRLYFAMIKCQEKPNPANGENILKEFQTEANSPEELIEKLKSIAETEAKILGITNFQFCE